MRRDVRMMAVVVCGLLAVCAQAGATPTIHVSRSAVISGDQITLGYICRFLQFDAARRSELEQYVVAPAPRAGMSAPVTAADVQRALRRAGVNLADVLVTGATTCAVSRVRTDGPVVRPLADRGTDQRSPASPSADPETPAKDAESKLLDLIRRSVAERLQPYGGRADIRVGRIGAGHFDPPRRPYTLSVRVRGGRWVGRAIRGVVELFVEGRSVASFPVMLSASITKNVVVARRAINQKATVRAEDVHLVKRTYDHLAAIPKATLDGVIGRQAKRFIPAGQSIRLSDLETVPLVKRGQIVEVVSRVGGVAVHSAAKAAGSGGLGDLVEVQAGGRRGDRLTAVVTGERQVTIDGGGGRRRDARARVALGTSHDE